MSDDIAILAGLAPEVRDRLAKDFRWRKCHRGQEILTADSDGTDVYVIGRGRLRVTLYSPSGREVAFRELEAGASFGELAAIDGHRRSVSVVAIEDAEIGALSHGQFWALLEAQPVVAANVLKMLAALIRDLTARVVDTTTLTVPKRVRAELVRLAQLAGPNGNAASVARFPTRAQLANQIGATREQVSRELSRMTEEGLIERRGRSIVVLDLEALIASAHDLHRALPE